MKLIYKQHKTNAVSIPKDWKFKELGSIVDFLDNSRKPIKDNDRLKIQGNIPYYGASGIVDYINDFLFDEDLILLGEDGENIISRNSRLAFKITGKSWVNNHAHVLRVHQEVDINYLSEYLESLNYEQYNTGTAQPKLNKSTCLGIPVLLPPRVEQRAIATALNDMDALLESLNSLIAKKRAIKQATMQQLLSGKTRLSGHKGKWHTKQLGELSEIRSGGTPSTSDKSAWSGEIPWCTPTDITALNGKKYLSQTSRSITEHGLRTSSAELIPKNSIIMTTRATIGECAINLVPMATNQGFKNIIPSNQIDTEFLYYLLSIHKQKLACLASGSTFLEIGKEQLRQITLFIPCSKEEQTDISNTIGDMDSEIEALNRNIEKKTSIKQAMMQELLTGRTRLI